MTSLRCVECAEAAMRRENVAQAKRESMELQQKSEGANGTLEAGGSVQPPKTDANKSDQSQQIIAEARELMSATQYAAFRSTLGDWKKREINEEQMIRRLLDTFLQNSLTDFARRFVNFIPRRSRTIYLEQIGNFERQ